MTSSTPQSEGLRLHHEQRRRQMMLLAALCSGAAKVGDIDMVTGICIIRVNEQRWECTLDSSEMPHVGSGLAANLERAMA